MSPVAQRATLQCVRKKTKQGIEYFTTVDEAEAHIAAYAKRIEEPLSGTELKAIIEIATNKELGIDQAERAVLANQQVRKENEKKVERRAAFAATYDELEQYTEEDSLAQTLLKQSFEAYVGGVRKNIGIGGGPYSQADADEALEVWTGTLDDAGTSVKFWGYRCQDKAAAGKGGVGGTLATRKFQANFLSKWNGVEINAHVDLNVAACP